MDMLYLFFVMAHLLMYSIIPQIEGNASDDHFKKTCPSFCILSQTCLLEDNFVHTGMTTVRLHDK